MTAQAVLDQIGADGLHSIRVVFADLHGLLRGKTIAASMMGAAFDRGVGVTGSLLHKDTGNNYAVGLWEPTGDQTLDQLVGARDIIMRPDPASFRVLPWVQGTGLVLSDLETVDGDPIPHSTRGICARALGRLAERGLDYQAGLELEFHLFLRDDDGSLHHSHPGWNLLGEDTLDRIEPLVEPIRKGLVTLDLPPTSIEAELGPSQIEMTFAPARGLAVADQAVIVRSAIRNVARRNGLQATFMSRPRLDGDGFPSGWHLHQSLVAANDPLGHSLFRPSEDSSALSELGQAFVAGLLHHAAASCLLTTPTVTGYKRYRPRAVTPDRISWSRQHRGAMLRAIGGSDDPSTRIENRAGDPAANPYLYVASQVLSGLDGIENHTTLPAPTESPYDPSGGALLPRSLGEAIEVFSGSNMYRCELGDAVVDYLAAVKRSEWLRFSSSVTDWEQREYLDQF